MYAIQTGNKFLKPNEQYHSFYDIVVTETPRFIKTKQDAETVKKAIIKQLDTSIARFQAQMESEGAKVAAELKKIPKIQAKLDALKELPYKDVYKKIPRYEKELKQAMWYKNANSLSSWKRDIARLERIKEGKVRVVKFNNNEAID